MEKNTVLLSIDDYNNLRDFFKGIKEGKFMYVTCNYRDIYYYEEKEIIEDLKGQIEELQKRLNKITLTDANKITLNEAKKMTVREFKRWRKQ